MSIKPSCFLYRLEGNGEQISDLVVALSMVQRAQVAERSEEGGILVVGLLEILNGCLIITCIYQIAR